LASQSVVQRIACAVVASSSVPAARVIEIGPGKGVLTALMLERAERVVAIEVDPAMVAHLQARFAGDPRLQLVGADVLHTSLAQWGPAVIAGNLPYYITSPILEAVFAAAGVIDRAVLMMQKEVALRLTASPGTRDYGYLTVLTRVHAEPRLLFTVPPGAFHPPPKVDSAVVELHLRRPDPDVGGFLEFARLCFRHKRKTLRNNLVGVYGARIAGAPEAGLRGEQLSVAELRNLYDRLT
jgi:16S rRNA (adenine1518-N6/adenine1519-N6)-dimethyltransferase